MNVLLAVLLQAAAAQGRDSLPRFTQFDFARVRIEHKVIVDASLTNTFSTDLADVRISVSYFDGDRELRKSKPVLLPKIAAGQSVSFKIEAVQLPNFDRYVLRLDSGPHKLIYVGNEAAPMPSPRSLPDRLVLESCVDLKPKEFPGSAGVMIAVTNAGDLNAREPVAMLTFHDAAGAIVHRLRVPLADSIKARCRDVFDATAVRVPAYTAVRATVAWIASEFPAPAPLQVEPKDLALNNLRIVRFTDGSVRVSGKARNGLAQDLEKASTTFKLGSSTHGSSLPVPLKAGEEKAFEFFVPECPAFEEWSFSVAYGDAAAAAAPAATPTPSATARRVDSKETTEGGGKPREKDPLEDIVPKTPKDPLAAGATAELRGLFWVEGITLKNKQYTGDVAFIKVHFKDAKGKAVQPVGVVTATVYIDGDRRTVSRPFRKESWKVDAGKVNAQTVSTDFMAFDAATGDLWVGLFRWDRMMEIQKADLSVRVVDTGTWDWKGLEKACTAGPKPPDKK